MRTRNRLFGGLGLVVLAGGIASAVPGCGEGGSTPSALEVTPDPIDFGDVRWGEDVERTVEVRNRSDRPVLWKQTAFDCSCYGVARPPDVLRLSPGESVKIVVVMRSMLAIGGRTKKNLTIVTDDPLQPKLDVPILANVLDVRRIDPSNVEFGDVDRRGDPVEKTVKVRSEGGIRVRVTKATSSNARLELVVKPAAAGADGSDVVVRTKRGADAGSLASQVVLEMEVTGEDGKTRTYRETVWVRGELGEPR
jgi:hypothetical protein